MGGGEGYSHPLPENQGPCARKGAKLPWDFLTLLSHSGPFHAFDGALLSGHPSLGEMLAMFLSCRE